MNWYKSAKIFKKASITLYVVDADKNADQFANIHDIGWQACIYAYNEIAKDKNDLAYFKEHNSVDEDSFVTMDGFGVNNTKGIINFYTSGIKEDRKQYYVNKILQFLDHNYIEASLVKLNDRSNMFNSTVARIKVAKRRHPSKTSKSPDINSSNENAFFIFNNVLGYNVDLWEFPEFDPKELKRRCIYYLDEKTYKGTKEKYQITQIGKDPNLDKFQDSYQKPQSNQEFFESDLSGRSANTSYTDEMVKDLLYRIIALCNWAIENKHDKLSVC